LAVAELETQGPGKEQTEATPYFQQIHPLAVAVAVVVLLYQGPEPQEGLEVEALYLVLKLVAREHPGKETMVERLHRLVLMEEVGAGLVQ
jgi:hypothetical protein